MPRVILRVSDFQVANFRLIEVIYLQELFPYFFEEKTCNDASRLVVHVPADSKI